MSHHVMLIYRICLARSVITIDMADMVSNPCTDVIEWQLYLTAYTQRGSLFGTCYRVGDVMI